MSKKKTTNVSKDHTLGLHVHREQLDHGEHAVFPFHSEADDPECVSFIHIFFYSFTVTIFYTCM